jgi:hypothetical protein
MKPTIATAKRGTPPERALRANLIEGLDPRLMIER